MKNRILFFLLSATLLVHIACKKTGFLLKGNLQGFQHLGIPVHDIEKSKAWYTEKLGFQVVHEPKVPTDQGDIKVAFLKRHDMMLELYQLLGSDLEEVKARKHGHIDHLAVDVLNIDTALEDVLKAGAELAESTPNGPVPIDVFYSKGITYVILKGPNGEKVELNQRLDLKTSRRKENLGGWSHLGIPVTDIERSKEFYNRLGFNEVMYAEIPAENQVIKASIM